MIIWGVFILFILLFLALDLGVFNKTPHIVSTKEASIWTFIWISIALCFSLLIFVVFKNDWVDNPTSLTPLDASLKYITGYFLHLYN